MTINLSFTSVIVSLLLIAGYGCSGTDHAANVNSVEYSVDESGCLISQNAEAVINYANGSNMSKTFIWNCAKSNGNAQKQRYEEFFVSYDGGQCFSHYQESASDAICTERAVAPAEPVFDSRITSFDVTPLATGGGYDVNTQLTNTGNATQYDLSVEYVDQYSFLHQGTRWLVTVPGGTLNDHAGVGSPTPPSKSFDVTATLKMWDGRVLDTQTKTVIIP